MSYASESSPLLKGGPFKHTPNLTSEQLKYIPLTEFVRPQETIIYISRPLDLESIDRMANWGVYCGSLMTCCLCLPLFVYSRSMARAKAYGSVVVVTDRTLYYHQLDMPYCGCCSVQSSTKSIPLEQIQDITVKKRGTAINSSFTADIIEVETAGQSGAGPDGRSLPELRLLGHTDVMELKRYISDASMAWKMAMRAGGAAVAIQPELMDNPTRTAPRVEEPQGRETSVRVWVHVVTEMGARSDRKMVVIPNIHADSATINGIIFNTFSDLTTNNFTAKLVIPTTSTTSTQEEIVIENYTALRDNDSVVVYASP